MAVIISYFEQFFQLIETLVNYFIQTILDVVYLVGLLVEMLGLMPLLFIWLPGTVAVTLVTAFALLVVLRIIGRDG